MLKFLGGWTPLTGCRGNKMYSFASDVILGSCVTFRDWNIWYFCMRVEFAVRRRDDL